MARLGLAAERPVSARAAAPVLTGGVALRRCNLDAQIAQEEAAFAAEAAAKFAEVISTRHPRPTPSHCQELAQLLAGVDRAFRPCSGAQPTKDSRSAELLRQGAVQANALLATLGEMKKHGAIPDAWRIADDLKSALEAYLNVVRPRAPGRPAAPWQSVLPALLPPIQSALLAAGWPKASLTDEGPVAAVASWALSRVWRVEVDQRTIARSARAA